MAELPAGDRPSWTGPRLARAARDLARFVQFYRDLVGLPIVAGFEYHAGYRVVIAVTDDPGYR